MQYGYGHGEGLWVLKGQCQWFSRFIHKTNDQWYDF